MWLRCFLSQLIKHKYAEVWKKDFDCLASILSLVVLINRPKLTFGFVMTSSFRDEDYIKFLQDQGIFIHFFIYNILKKSMYFLYK